MLEKNKLYLKNIVILFKIIALKKLLIINEDSDITYILKQKLEALPISITCAHFFDDATSNLNSQEFDIIITDIAIKGYSGIEYIEYLNINFPKSVVIIISEMDQAQVQSDYSELKIAKFLSYPIKQKHLEDALKPYLV